MAYFFEHRISGLFFWAQNKWVYFIQKKWVFFIEHRISSLIYCGKTNTWQVGHLLIVNLLNVIYCSSIKAIARSSLNPWPSFPVICFLCVQVEVDMQTKFCGGVFPDAIMLLPEYIRDSFNPDSIKKNHICFYCAGTPSLRQFVSTLWKIFRVWENITNWYKNKIAHKRMLT